MSDIRYNSWLHRSGTGGVYQDSSGKVGIGTSVPGGAGLHIKEGYSGLSAPGAHQDTLYLENSGNAGITIATPNTNTGYLTFADPDDDNIGQIIYRHNGNSMGFFVNAAERLRIDTDGRVGINTDTMSTANSGFDDLVIRSSAGGNTGITFLSSTTAQGTLAFADGSSSTAPYRGYLQYSHNGDRLVLGAGGADRVTVDTDGNVNISGVTTAKAFVPTTYAYGTKNLVVNGAMQVAQRGTSSTSSGYQTIDRMPSAIGNTGQSGTQSRQSLSSSATGPFSEGFRNYKRYQIAAAGNANTNAYVEPLYYKVEAQDLAASGWDCESSSSYITLSFWVRVSTNQTFYVNLRSEDGTKRMFTIPFTASANNTWTKIVQKIPGNTSPTVQIDNNNATGMSIYFAAFYGTDYTASVNTLVWNTYNAASQCPDMASTWLAAGASTFDITGLQIEVGEEATPYQFLRYDDDFRRCMRYYQEIQGSSGTTLANLRPMGHDSNTIEVIPEFLVPMRAGPTVTFTGTIQCRACAENTTDSTVTLAGSSWEAPSTNITTGHIWCDASSGTPFTPGYSGRMKSGASGSSVNFSAEL